MPAKYYDSTSLRYRYPTPYIWLPAMNTCPVCLATSTVITSYGGVSLLRCTNCHAYVTVNFLPAEEVEAYYSDEYQLHHSVATSRERHRMFRMPEYQDMIGRVLAVHPNVRHWLDVGCDHGFLLDEVRRCGIHVEGVEPQHSARRYAQSVGINVVPALSDAHGTADVLSLMHVLEHVSNPREFLAQCSTHLKSNGVLFIRVPDFGSVWSRILRHRWIWFQPSVHCVHYSKKALQGLLEDLGFTIVALKRRRANTMLTHRSFWLSLRTFRRYRGIPFPSLREIAARLYQDITGCEILVIATKDSHISQ